MKLEELLKALPGAHVLGDTHMEVSGIYYDSRQVKPGGVFVCIQGFKTDGHRYIEDALKRGARAVVVEKPMALLPQGTLIKVENSRWALAQLACTFYGHPSRYFDLIGVTGTNGKTSFTYLIRSILQEQGEKVGLLGTIANYIGDKEIASRHTTPESVDLQCFFRKMVEEKATYGVMEVSSHALELERVAGTEFDVAVFTNFSQDHLDFHANLEDYFAAKAKLFQGLGRGEKKRPKYAVINSDDPYYPRLVEVTPVPTVTYGLGPKAQYRARDVKININGISYEVVYSGGTFNLNLKLAGNFSVYNSLAAVAVALEEGIAVEVVQRALEKMPGVPGRFQLVNCGQDFGVVVDYAHTPDSLENVLKTAREVASGRVITVFGCGGDRDKTKRPLMGEKAAYFSDYCIITSDNPRSEDPQAIIADIEPGVVKIHNRYEIILDRKEAIEKAIAMAQGGDLVVIAGKGHEKYQIIGDEVLPFDDVAVAEEILTKVR